MSYEIIKSIKVKDNKVLVNYACNNVRPLTFEECESQYLTKILKEQGKEALDIEILKAYEEGNFQRGTNKYTRALHILRHFPEYPLFDWRNSGIKKNDPVEKRRESIAFIDLLKKALNSRLPKDKYIITKFYNGHKVYGRRYRYCMKWTHDRLKASIYRYKSDAEFQKKCFTNADNWQIEDLNKPLLNEADLNNFTGTLHYYKHLSGYNYTDGIKYLAEQGNAYWLIDKILFTTKHKKELQDFGVWKLSVDNKSATLSCEDGNYNKLYEEKIGYTDFPLNKIELWFENGVLILTSEH